jgi:hypothetical protein
VAAKVRDQASRLFFSGVGFAAIMKKTTFHVLAGATALLAGHVSQSQAQTPADVLQRGASVMDRPRPELDPLGVRAGSFLIFPEVEAGTAYQSNVYATPDDEVSDFIFTLSPSVVAQSDFTRHSLTFEAGAEIGRYLDETSENYIDYRAAAAGRFDVGARGAATGRVAHIRNHEERGDPDEEFSAAEPVEYSSTLGEVGYRHTFNRVTAGVGASAEWIDYDDVTLIDGTNSDQDDRDRWVYSTNARLGYEIQSGFEAFVRGTYSVIEYDREDIARDSDGYEIVVGSDFDLTGLLTGTAYVGYLARDFDNPAFEDPSGLAFGLDLDWALTQRTIEESTSTSSRERTQFGVGVDHELLRNLILQADAVYRLDDFVGSPREDDFYTIGLGALYTLNRNFYGRAGYIYETRESNVSRFDYDDNIISLSIGARL